MRVTLQLLSVLLVSSCAASAQISGSSVTGFVGFSGGSTNYFNSSNGFVPAGYGNSGTGSTTVTIGPRIEFALQDIANLDTADFTATDLVLSDTVSSSSSAPNNSIVFTFSDPAFDGFSLSSDSFPGLTFAYSGDTLTVDIPPQAAATPNRVFTADFAYGTDVAATPEPSSLILFGTGVLGLADLARRRYRATRC